MTTACPGPCNRAHRDADARVDSDGRPVPHQLTATPGGPVWCLECATGIVGQLAELVVIVALLEHEIGGQRGAADDAPVSGSRGRPSPCAAVDDIDEITRHLEYWEDAGRELMSCPWRPFRPYDRRAAAAAGWLIDHADLVLAAPFAEELGRDITRLHRAGRRRTSTDTAKTRKPVPCPGCDLLALTHAGGERYISCGGCGRLLSFDEYDAWARLKAAHETATRRTA
jgi:hypothetical protein